MVFDYDILCFIELYLNFNILNDEIFIDGYNIIFWKDRNLFGGGIII